MKIDLNADVGEGSDDAALFDIVSSVNIACGAHAGDEQTMNAAIDLALARGVRIGAHPGYADRETLGRTPMHLEPPQIEALLLQQIHALGIIASRKGIGLHHVKPHGALYNQAAVEPQLAEVIAYVVSHIHPAFKVVGLAGSEQIRVAREHSVQVLEEAFADRAYLADGTLAPRGTPGALIEDPARAAAQAVRLAQGEPVETVDGGTVIVRADTICCHGDTPGAVAIATAVRAGLEDAGFTIAPPD